MLNDDIRPGDRYEGPGAYTVIAGPLAVSRTDLNPDGVYVAFDVRYDDGGNGTRYFLRGHENNGSIVRPELPDPTAAEPEALAELTDLTAAADERVAELRRHAEVCHSSKPLPASGHVETVLLDCVWLRNLREAWEYGADDEVIVGRVRDLFEGGDGVLAVIDRTIGPSGVR